MKVNLYVREPKQHVKYHFSSFNIDQDHFPMKLDIKEVINLTEKQRKKYKMIVKTFLTTTVGFLSLTSKSMAQVLTTTTSQNTGMFGLPTDFIEPMLMLIKMALGGGFLLAILLMIAAGALRMLRKKKEATEWTTDIIKGFTQIIIAIPVIFLIFYVAIQIFGNFEMFLNPLETSLKK